MIGTRQFSRHRTPGTPGRGGLRDEGDDVLTGDDGLNVLSGEECRRLLERARHGRVGFTAQALPAVQPVQLRMRDGRIVFPVAPAGRLATACRGAVVAVQADGHCDAADWTVEVVGVAQVVTEPAEVAGLDRLVGTGTAPAEHCWVAVDIGLISGWRTAPSRRAIA